jgi:diketogulonate reductase-like aldo/keto reductase
MPILASGVYQFNSSEAEESIVQAVEAGFTAIDTALDYWNQDGVGRALKTLGKKGLFPFVETKVPGCANPLENTTRNPFTCYKDTVANLQRDLDQLDVPHVDLVIIHFPPFPSFQVRSCNDLTGSCEMARQQWKALTEFYKAGKAKAIGVSNYCPSCLECLAYEEVQPMVNQVMYHVGMFENAKPIVAYHKEKGIVTQAYSALGNTPWGHHADPDILSGDLTSGIAKAHGISTVEVALKWLVNQGVPAVTKSGNPKHLKSDLNLWSWDFDEDEIKQLNAMKSKQWFQDYSYACNSMTDAVVV